MWEAIGAAIGGIVSITLAIIGLVKIIVNHKYQIKKIKDLSKISKGTDFIYKDKDFEFRKLKNGKDSVKNLGQALKETQGEIATSNDKQEDFPTKILEETTETLQDNESI